MSTFKSIGVRLCIILGFIIHSFFVASSFADINPQGTLIANALQVSKAFFAKSRSSNFWRPVWHPRSRHLYREIAVHVSTLVSRHEHQNPLYFWKYRKNTFHIVWKSPKMSQFSFSILAFSSNFVLFKLTILVTIFDPKFQVFKKSPKLIIFAIFLTFVKM